MKLADKAKSFVLATTVLLLLAGCETNNSSSNSNGNTDSTAGSRARMALIGDYLYAISGEDVQLLDISAPASPNFWNRIQLDWDIETLFPYGDYLLVGSETGVHILDNSTPGSPRYLSEFSHARACDPVVAANDIAYVTLNSSRNCWLQTSRNQLDVLDLSDMSNPTLIKTYPMQEPTGLAVKDQWLYVCDGRAGLKVFNNIDPENMSVVDQLPEIDCFDLIAKDNILYVSTDDKLLQYDISDIPMDLISELQIDD